MKSIKYSCLTLLLFVIILFSSCTTTVRFRVTRPGEVDLNGAKTISVLPFKPYEYFRLNEDSDKFEILVYSFLQVFDKSAPEEKKALDYLQEYIEDGLSGSQYINVVSASSVSNALKKGYINPADVYLTGEVTYFYIEDLKNVKKVLVKKGDPQKHTKDQYDFIDEYSRNVKMDIRYQIVDSSTDHILSSRKITISTTSSKVNEKKNLPSAYSIIQGDLSDAGRRILRELQPYVITRSVTLLKDKTKNEAFKEADKLAKNGNITLSYEKFNEIYKETQLFEAGYNAAILQMSLGNLSVSEQMMVNLYNKTNDSRAASAISDIRNEIKLAKKLKNQIEEKELTLD